MIVRETGTGNILLNNLTKYKSTPYIMNKILKLWAMKA